MTIEMNVSDRRWKELSVPVQDAKVLRQEAIEAHHDHLITEIESTEGSLATTLRSVYDGDDLEQFQERLQECILEHDSDIERMCNHHYQGFIHSVRELQQVGGDAAGLKQGIKEVDGELHCSSQLLLNLGDKLCKSRQVQKNITEAIEVLSHCLPVLEMYGKLRDQMNDRRHYPALKTLEQLEHTYLPRVSSHWFSNTMAETIPKLRLQIQEASMTEIKDFLENIRKRSIKIGEVAMQHAAIQNCLDPTIARKGGKKRRAPPPPNPFTGEVELSLSHSSPSDNDTEDMCAQDLVDFSPVYRCLHIYTVLGDRDQFETYYRQQRWKQARLALQPLHNMHECLESFRKYFYDVVGFFVVEDHVLHTTQGLITHSYIDELWEKAVEKMSATLRCTAKSCSNGQLMLDTKSLIVLFCHTLKDYGFGVGRLLELLLEMRDRYCEILSEQWGDIFTEIFMTDNYTPICCDTEEDFVELVSQFPFQMGDWKKSSLSMTSQMSSPYHLSFSRFVPDTYNQVKQYINACLKFSADLLLSHTEIDDMIRKSTNQLLTQTLGRCLFAFIKRPELSLLQLVQISININYLEQLCPHLEEYISNITGAEKNSVHVAHLHGSSMFKDSRNVAEQQMYHQLNTKVDGFLELVDYDWMTTEPARQACSYILDMVAFLHSVFVSFTTLPDQVAETACMSACQHIASKLTGILFDQDLHQLSMAALEQFNLDVQECEKFATANPVPGSDDGTLRLAFSDLRQLLDLFTGWDWSAYLADYGKQHSAYLRVHHHTALNLLERLNNSNRKKNLFPSMKKSDREKKRLLDTVLKQLRTLENGPAH